MGSWHVSHYWTSSFDDHFYHDFVQRCTKSRQIEKTSRSTGHYQHCSDQSSRARLDSSFGFGDDFFMWCYATSFLVLDLWSCWIGSIGSGKNGTLLWLNSKDQEKEFHLRQNLHWLKLFQLLLTCLRLTSVSYTSNLLTLLFDFRKCAEFLQMLIFNLHDLQQNQSPEIILICIIVLHFPHDKIVQYSTMKMYQK